MINCSDLIYLNSPYCKTNMVLGAWYAVLAPLTVTVNCLLLASMIGSKQALSNTSHKLVTCTSIISLLSGASCMPLMAMTFLPYVMNGWLPVALQLIGSFLFFLSSFVMVLMAVDRYIHMKASFAGRRSIFEKLLTGRLILVPLSLCVMCSALVSVASIKFHTFGNIGKMVALVVMAVCHLIFIPCIAVLYIRGYIRVKEFVQHNPVYNEPFRQGNLESSSGSSHAGTQARVRPAYVRNLQKTVLILIITLMITHTPVALAGVIFPIIYATGKQPMKLSEVIDVLSLFYYHHFIIHGLVVFKMNHRARDWLVRRTVGFTCRLIGCDEVMKTRRQPEVFHMTTNAKST